MIMDRLHTDLRITTLLALANVIATACSSASCSAKPSRATDVLATKATATSAAGPPGRATATTTGPLRSTPNGAWR
jgi:hypothetical protein